MVIWATLVLVTSDAHEPGRLLRAGSSTPRVGYRVGRLPPSPALWRGATRLHMTVASGERTLASDGEFCMWSTVDGVRKMRVRAKGTECTFETGSMALLAGGAVTVTAADTVVFATACFQAGGTPADFVPLRVDYQERYSAAGMTAGGYIKRDGRAGDSEILTARLIDRPIRPAFPKGWSQETQICSYVLSYDGSCPPDCLAVCASSAALVISDVPFDKPVACVRVSRGQDGNFVVNAPVDAQAESDLSLVVAGTKDAMLMIEGFCRFVPEADIIAAAAVGHEAVGHICDALAAWREEVGKPKATHLVRAIPAGVKEACAALCNGRIEEYFCIPDKKSREQAFDALRSEVDKALAGTPAPALPRPAAHPIEDVTSVDGPSAVLDDADDDEEAMPDDEGTVPEGVPPHSALHSAPAKADAPADAGSAMELADVQNAFKALASEALRAKIAGTNCRPDGRTTTEVRKLRIDTSVLPRTHGSALFTRGETQSLATVTLGDASAAQKFEGMTGAGAKRFYLQYTFPPFSVGEVGRVGGMPGRREVGHGNLAEQALVPAMPSAEDFPYTVRARCRRHAGAASSHTRAPPRRRGWSHSSQCPAAPRRWRLCAEAAWRSWMPVCPFPSPWPAWRWVCSSTTAATGTTLF